MLQQDDKFKVKTGCFRGQIFTVEKITPGERFDVVCSDETYDAMCFESSQLEKYGYQILNLEHRTLKQAQAQVLASAMVGADEQAGGRVYKAWEKACRESEENTGIEFENQVLKFTSRFSNLFRVITSAGCSDLCSCGNQISYHAMLYKIVARYYELKTANVVKRFPVKTARRIQKAA
jgi:hypothetical protein